MSLRNNSDKKGTRPASYIGFRRSWSERDVDVLKLDSSSFYTEEEDEVAAADVGDSSKRDPAARVIAPVGGVACVIKTVTESTTANWFKDSGPLDSTKSAGNGDNGSDRSESTRERERRKEHLRSSSSGSTLDLFHSKTRSPSMRNLHNRSKVSSLLVPDERESQTLSRLNSPWNGPSAGKKVEILYENFLNLAKLPESDKKRMRKHWVVSWAVLTPQHLSFFKNENYKKNRPIKPDIIVELLFCRTEWTKALSNRENVFLVTSPKMKFLCQSNSESEAQNWYSRIENTMKSNQQNFKSLFDEGVTKRYSGSTSLGREGSSSTLRRSTKKFAVTPEVKEPKQSGGGANIRGHLLQFLNRRPPKQDLVEKGIYKDGAVFGCTLEELTTHEERDVPEFMEKCIGVIEGKEENLKADGIYRASGNLSLIQRIRMQVDQNRLSILETEDDIHVLAGALKLFLREMREPLIPTDMFDKFLRASQLPSMESRIEEYKKLVADLPKPNYATLKFLFQHLLKISDYKEFNRMQISNLSIVFGPTIMWSPVESNCSLMAVDLMQQNYIVETLLTHFHSIFVH